MNFRLLLLEEFKWNYRVSCSYVRCDVIGILMSMSWFCCWLKLCSCGVSIKWQILFRVFANCMLPKKLDINLDSISSQQQNREVKLSNAIHFRTLHLESNRIAAITPMQIKFHFAIRPFGIESGRRWCAQTPILSTVHEYTRFSSLISLLMIYTKKRKKKTN